MEMDAAKKRKIRNRITIASLVLLVLVAVFLFAFASQGSMNQGVFIGVIVGFLVVYWILLDVVEPKLLHEFDDLTPERKTAYIKYAGLDAIGFAGLAFFVFNIGNTGNMGLIGAVVYIVTISMKKKARDEFYGRVPVQEEEADEDVAEDAEAIEDTEAEVIEDTQTTNDAEAIEEKRTTEDA